MASPAFAPRPEEKKKAMDELPSGLNGRPQKIERTYNAFVIAPSGFKEGMEDTTTVDSARLKGILVMVSGKIEEVSHTEKLPKEEGARITNAALKMVKEFPKNI